MRGYSLSFDLIKQVGFIFKETKVWLFYPTYGKAFDAAQKLPDNAFRVQIRGVR